MMTREMRRQARRDAFVGAALEGLLAHAGRNLAPQEAAHLALRFADAVLEAEVEAESIQEAVRKGPATFEQVATMTAERIVRALEPERCEVPPAGWECSREPHHPGPCAATPAVLDLVVERVADLGMLRAGRIPVAEALVNMLGEAMGELRRQDVRSDQMTVTLSVSGPVGR